MMINFSNCPGIWTRTSTLLTVLRHILGDGGIIIAWLSTQPGQVEQPKLSAGNMWRTTMVEREVLMVQIVLQKLSLCLSPIECYKDFESNAVLSICTIVNTEWTV